MTGKPRVFVVQRPAFYCKDSKGWRNKYNISPAREFGELVVLLQPGNIYRDQLDAAVRSLGTSLADFTERDHLLAIGDPVAIAAAVLTAGKATGGKVRMLKYDRFEGRYNSYEVAIANPTLVPSSQS